MKQLHSINKDKPTYLDIIFEKDSANKFTKKALLYQNIMEYNLETNDDITFRFTDLARWLMEKNNEFREYYSDSKAHIPKSTRIALRRHVIQSCINDLMELDLILNRGKTKAEKNDLVTPLYEYTTEGQILSFILLYNSTNSYEELSKKTEKRDYVCRRIFNLVQQYLSGFNSHIASFASRFFVRAWEERVFHVLIDLLDEFLNEIGARRIRSVFQVFNGQLHYLLVFPKQTAYQFRKKIMNIYMDVLNEMDDEIRKIVMYDKKNIDRILLRKQYNSTFKRMGRTTN